MSIADDLIMMLNDIGDTCTAVVGGTVVTFPGVFSIRSETQLDNSNQPVVITHTSLLVTTDTASTLKSNTRITVNDKTWKISQKYLTDDGSTTELMLMEL